MRAAWSPLLERLVTPRGTATGLPERRTERERENHVRERAMATIAPGADATLAGSLQHVNPATVTLGQHTHGVTAAAPNRTQEPTNEAAWFASDPSSFMEIKGTQVGSPSCDPSPDMDHRRRED
jgi:hypothetical protein